MPTLGEELKRRREERNISLADISEATRIGTRFLKAIESDNYSILPGGIFTRSFIRAYAKQVGLNEDEAVALYQLQVTGQAAEAAPPQPQAVENVVRQIPPPEKRPRKPDPITYRQPVTRTNWSTVIIGVGIVVFVGLIVWALVQKFGSGGPTEQAATASPPPEISQTTPTEQPAQPATAEQPPEGEQQPPAPVAEGQPLVVRLEASGGDSSIQYWIDEAPKPTTVTVRDGQAQDLTAQKQIRFNIGNRPVLKLKINNRDAVFPPDTPKWGAKVTISRDNLQAFTP
ncbi:MAG TPA: helix-turn-helix domain-containing protein [Blastocatellia bacterium]|nr:helix-turn-helix domain-containing protein [Blastocatellia bacterium]